MNVFMTIFFIVLAITIVMYAAMLKRQADRDKFMRSSGRDEQKGESRTHSTL